MQRLNERIGAEHPVDNQTRAIRDFVRECDVQSVGAMHVTCSEPSERECVESFQHHFAEDQLPSHPYAEKSPFRTATLGGRYEWGAVSVAESYFAAEFAPDDSRLLLVKINAHVAVSRDGNDTYYGSHQSGSPMCAALERALAGEQTPAMISLREALCSEGIDRVAMLNDAAQVNPQYRGLLAALASARLQARRAVLDIQNTVHSGNVRIIVLPAVTLNRVDRDTEILIGYYDANCRGASTEIRYRGLGDDPGQYVVAERHNLLTISDGNIGRDRAARDHRVLVAQAWQPRAQQIHFTAEQSPKIVALAERAAAKPTVSQEVLKTFLRLLADVAIVPTAVTLFIDGAAGIHNIYRAYRLSHGTGSRDDAEEIVNDTLSRVANLDERQAREVMLQLAQGLGIPLPEAERVDHTPSTVETFEDVSPAAQVASEAGAALTMDSSAGPQLDASLTMEAPRPAVVAARQAPDPDEFTTAAPPSMDLELGAGSNLEMSSLPETTLSLTEPVLSGLEAPDEKTAEKKSPAASVRAATASDDVLGTELKAIVDDTPAVTGIEAPQIDSQVASITDTAKDVGELASPEIDLSEKKIQDHTKDVTELATPSPSAALAAIEIPEMPEYNAPEIKSQEFQAPEVKVPQNPSFSTPATSIPTTPLRQPHVVQPGQSQRPSPQPESTAEPDLIIDAELIPIDGDEDAIIIIDPENR